MIEYDEHAKATSKGIKRSLFDIVILGPLFYVGGEILTILVYLLIIGVGWVLASLFDQTTSQRIMTVLLFSAVGYAYYWFLWGRNRKYRKFMRYWNHGTR